MLIKNFYTVHSLDSVESSLYESKIELNSKSEIFKGHFPNKPVMPGVCMMQILKELVESVLGKKLFMNKASNVKFMTLVNPEVNNILKFSFEIISEIEKNIKVKCTIFYEDVIALKMNVYFYISEE